MKLPSKNPIVLLLKTLWQQADGYRGTLLLYVAMFIVAMLIELCLPLAIRELFNSVQNSTGQNLINNTAYWSFIYILIGILFWFLHGPAQVIQEVLSFRIKRIYQAVLFKKVTRLPMKWHKDHHSGATIDQITSAMHALGDFTQHGYEVIYIIIQYFGSIIILSTFLPLASVMVITSTVIVIFMIIKFDKKLIEQYKLLNRMSSKVSATVQDYLTNISTIISLRLEERVLKEVKSKVGKQIPLVRNNKILNELKWFSTGLVINITNITILFLFIFNNVKNGKIIEIGTLYALWEYLKNIGGAFNNLTWKYGVIVLQGTKILAVNHIIEAYDKENYNSENATIDKSWKKIEIKSLCFTHQEEDSKISDDIKGNLSKTEKGIGNNTEVQFKHKTPIRINGLEFQLERGKSYAFIGESGSGKSTVLGLLRGLHKPEKINVYCDGELMPHGIAHIAHITTLIPQEPEIFSDTIRFNVAMGIDIEDFKIMNAINRAQFSSVLDRLPKGLETNIAEKGINLSGGEKQRLALARGLFFAEESESKLILLDEPTSSVDPFNEKIIYQNLLKLFKDKCVVSAIHKIHLLNLFDVIVVFENGKIVDTGTLSELRDRCGVFKKLTEE